MIGALELFAADDPQMKRELTMGTSIRQRE
jgi:hypothetical protein